MNEKEALAALSALAGATRLRVLRLLVRAAPDGLTAGEISAATEATPSRASFHLASLAKAGLVTQRRDGRQITYQVDFATVGRLLGYILTDCCQNNPTVLSCCTPSGPHAPEAPSPR